MKVHELIKALQEQDPDSDLFAVVTGDNGEGIWFEVDAIKLDAPLSVSLQLDLIGSDTGQRLELYCEDEGEQE